MAAAMRPILALDAAAAAGAAVGSASSQHHHRQQREDQHQPLRSSRCGDHADATGFGRDCGVGVGPFTDAVEGRAPYDDRDPRQRSPAYSRGTSADVGGDDARSDDDADDADGILGTFPVYLKIFIHRKKWQ